MGRCRVVRPLGKGGMGEVYLAEHLSLQKQVAIKILPPDLVSRESVERFVKEARMCSRIEHPNVVVIHDVGQHGRLYYIVMQYVQGHNLTELLQQYGGILPWRSAVRICQLAAKGLHAVHSQGLVHRDVKPSNIMLARDSRVLLMDFGLVREEGDTGLTRTGQMVGTPSFMSPEQCRGELLDRRSDIYSLGCTLYCLLAGRPPFTGSLQEVLAKIAGGACARPLEGTIAGLPAEVSRAVAKAMAPGREERFPTAEAMAKELRRLQQATAVEESSAWRTAEVSSPGSQTHSLVPVEPLELLPLDSETEAAAWARYWPLAVGIFALLLAVGLLLNLPLRPRAVQQPAPPASQAAQIEPKPVAPQRPSDAPRPPVNMVYVESGYAQVGDDVQKIRALVQANPLVAQAMQTAGGVDVVLARSQALGTIDSQKRVQVPGFWIDPYEVTCAEYARFVGETNHEAPPGWTGNASPAGQEDHPVHNVRYRDAEMYAKWAGKQLPTLEQWMRAFRGDSQQLFPWGDTFDPGRTNTSENHSFPSSSPITATPQDVSPMKVYNMVGNVMEYLREATIFQGQKAVVLKGACFGTPAALTGFASARVVVAEGIASPGFGIRCVWEQAGSSLRQ